MEIIIKKGKKRNTLTCIRKDETFTSENLGPDFPNHDIAHYVVEKAFNLKNGFYGAIKSGMSIAQLSDKEIIKQLGEETWLAEIMTRNLQAIQSGSATIQQYKELIELETNHFTTITIPKFTDTAIEKLKSEFDKLCQQWELLTENEELKLTF